MKRMSLFILLSAVFAIVVCPSILFAVNFTTSITSVTFTASLTPSGGVQQYDASLKTRGTNASAGSLSWTGVAAGNAGYKLANEYILINSTVTNVVGFRMNIYTDNLIGHGSNFYAFHTNNNVPFSDQAASVSTASVKSYGLIGQANPTNSDENINGTCYGLPLAWMVLDKSSAVPTTPIFSISRSNGTQGFTNFMWKFVQDKGRKNVNGTTAWDPTSTYVRIWDQDGFYWNEDPTKAGIPTNGDVFIYLAIDSTNAKAQVYKTVSLTVDALQL